MPVSGEWADNRKTSPETEYVRARLVHFVWICYYLDRRRKEERR